MKLGLCSKSETLTVPWNCRPRQRIHGEVGAAGVPWAQRALLAGFVFRRREVVLQELLLELSSSWHSRAGAVPVGWRSRPAGHTASSSGPTPPFLGESPRPAVLSLHTEPPGCTALGVWGQKAAAATWRCSRDLRKCEDPELPARAVRPNLCCRLKYLCWTLTSTYTISHTVVLTAGPATLKFLNQLNDYGFVFIFL